MNEESETFKSYTTESILQTSREELTAYLLESGMWPLIKQRPFNKIADPDRTPKAVFINAANSAPFQADFSVILKGDEDAFQAGVNALSRLTEGPVHLCTSAGIELPSFDHVENAYICSKYPSGNTSVHINRISPILPNDTVYTITAQNVILLGKLLTTGELPRTKVFALAGPAVKESARKYYRVPLGASLDGALAENFEGEEIRLINGNIMWGDKLSLILVHIFMGQNICY